MPALVISIFAVGLLGAFLWVAKVRARWKAGAVLAFASALALLLAGGSPLLFVAGLALQTLLAISLILYFKVEF
ncbi:MAG TPA: hypothetical protein VNW71_25890 [Thermoanaerobaculia bacterium]|nr:hypothetical protein [Thermoanaerobaculia bacterium]